MKPSAIETIGLQCEHIGLYTGRQHSPVNYKVTTSHQIMTYLITSRCHFFSPL